MIWDSSAYQAVRNAIKEGAIKQVKAQLSKYFNTLNHRIQRLEKAGLQNTPAYMSVQKSGGRFKVGGKSLDELSKEFSRGLAFEKAKTSQVSTARQYIKRQAQQFSESVKQKFGGNASGYDVFKTAERMLMERADVQSALMRAESLGIEKVKYKYVENYLWEQFVNDTMSETDREAEYIMSTLTYEDLEERISKYADNMVNTVEEMIEDIEKEIAQKLSSVGGF